MNGIWTTREVAERLKVKPSTICQWAKANKIKGFKLSKAPNAPWRFREAEVERLIDKLNSSK